VRRPGRFVYCSFSAPHRRRDGGSGGESMLSIARHDNPGILLSTMDDDDDPLYEKLKKAIDEANVVLRENPMLLREAIRFLATHLIHHHDPDVRAYSRHLRAKNLN
jgi:hypothetical protein